MASIFQHFGSKARLFLQAYKRAVLTLPAWLDAPDDVQAEVRVAAQPRQGDRDSACLRRASTASAWS